MKTKLVALACVSVTSLLLVSGCATTSQTARGTEQFDPVPPVAAADTQTLDAVTSPRTVTDLLREADQAFRAANTAQEAGDEEAALRQYVRMLELLTEADLDPKLFYSLRQEFGNILNTTSQHASLFQSREGSPLDGGVTTPTNFSAFEIPFPLPERVLQEIDEIQNVYPKNFQTFLDRSHKYMPHIRKRLQEEGMPEELAYLALVESGFQQKIVSRAGAGGMWQFMRPTARRFNLRVDSHVDERYDWQSATDAAIEYLKVLHNEFGGDWSLALSAYNMGEGGLARAMEANGGERDIWKLYDTPPACHRIQNETKKYYPRFIATLIVAHSPERYGFKTNIQSPEDTVQVPVNGFYALSELDRAMGYPDGTLAGLNPALLNETTPPAGAYHVLVPAVDSTKFASALQNAPAMRYASGTHKVKRGETISQIASRHGTSASELMRVNGIRSPRSLRAGQTLKLPDSYEAVGRGGEAESAVEAEVPSASAEPEVLAKNTPPAEPQSRAAAVPARGKATYVVKSGDTLYDIAKAHNVSVTDLQNWNSKGRRARLKVGESLYVGKTAPAAPAPSAAPASTSSGDRYHVVKSNEYPAQIARDYNIPLKDFLAWNNLGSKSTIKVGDRLVVAANVAEQVPAPELELAAAPARSEKRVVGTNADVPGLPKTHTVRKGESASTIASKYGIKTSEFLAWNGLTSKSILRAGESYRVHAPEGGTAAPERKAKKAADVTHTVAKGQNPTTIARRYGVKLSDLFKWNNWSKDHVLRVGDKVVVRKG
jgi:membrane-bound lytic murein transglycosylase D